MKSRGMGEPGGKCRQLGLSFPNSTRMARRPNSHPSSGRRICYREITVRRDRSDSYCLATAGNLTRGYVHAFIMSVSLFTDSSFANDFIIIPRNSSPCMTFFFSRPVKWSPDRVTPPQLLRYGSPFSSRWLCGRITAMPRMMCRLPERGAGGGWQPSRPGSRRSRKRARRTIGREEEGRDSS